jgi:hypothetical protein
MDDTAAFLEEVARLAATVRGQLWRNIGIEATKRAKALRQPPGATAAQIAGMHKAIWDASEGDFDASDDECAQILEAARRLTEAKGEWIAKVLADYETHYDFPQQGRSHMRDCLDAAYNALVRDSASSGPAMPADTQPDRPCADPSSDRDFRPGDVPPSQA